MINPKISKRGGGGYAAAEQAGEISNGPAGNLSQSRQTRNYII
jgi:hypothetical protein